jgi:hypothetical protein
VRTPGLTSRTRNALTSQLLDLFVERFNVLELPIDGSEADVRDLIELSQLVHHQLSDDAGLNLAITESAYFVHHPAHGLIDRFARHRTLFQRLLHAASQFRFVKRFAIAIALHDDRHYQFSGLEGRETLTAGEAFAPTPNLPTLAGEARVVDFGFDVAAEGAVHGSL